jgi:hypothetical protein
VDAAVFCRGEATYPFKEFLCQLVILYYILLCISKLVMLFSLLYLFVVAIGECILQGFNKYLVTELTLFVVAIGECTLKGFK